MHSCSGVKRQFMDHIHVHLSAVPCKQSPDIEIRHEFGHGICLKTCFPVLLFQGTKILDNNFNKIDYYLSFFICIIISLRKKRDSIWTLRNICWDICNIDWLVTFICMFRWTLSRFPLRGSTIFSTGFENDCLHTDRIC